MTTQQARTLGAVPRRQPGAADAAACPPGVLPGDQIALVERIHREFLRGLGQALSEYLETPVTTAKATLEQMALAEFLAGGEGDCLIALDLGRVPGQAFLSLGTGFVFRTLGILIGAPMDSISPCRSSVTDIELHILREFFDALRQELRKAWASAKVDFKLANIGTNLANRPTSNADGPVVVLSSVVHFGEAEESFRLAMPALLVRLAALELTETVPARVPAAQESRTLCALRAATLQVEVVLDGSMIRMGDLLEAEPGQVLMLGNPAGSTFACLVNGKAKFRGELIQTQDRQALQIASLAGTGSEAAG